MKRIGVAGLVAVVVALGSFALLGSGWDPEKEKVRKESAEVDRTIVAFKRDTSNLEIYFRDAYGWAVFPTIGTGGLVLSGAYGTGQVYEQGRLIGRATTKKAGLGLTIGGGTYSALNSFTNGDLKFEAGAKVMAIRGGEAAETSWNDGIAVFLRSKKGLMADASVSGQAFAYEPLGMAQAAR